MVLGKWVGSRDGAVAKTSVNTNGLTGKKTLVYTPQISKLSYIDSNDVVFGRQRW